MALRDDARAFFGSHLQPRTASDEVSFLGGGAGDDELEAGRRHLALLAEGGWGVPTWPAEHGGRGLSSEQAGVVAAELSRFDVPDLYPYGVGLALVGPTLMVHGTTEQQSRWMRAIATGEEIWCQLFSEPDAGSDLANLGCRAERGRVRGAGGPAGGRDQWRITGQKTWSSRAHYSQWGLLLARTDVDVPKHSGITAFAIRMDQPGVEVRPLRQINGDEHFNEVFLDGAVVDDADRIGQVGEGWRVALTVLGFERAGIGGGGGGGLGGGVHREQLIEHVRAHADLRAPLVRDRLARVLVEVEAARLTGMRARDNVRSGTPGPEGSGGKIRLSDTMKHMAGLAVDVQGIAGVTEVAAPDWDAVFLTAPSISIRGGTDEIQRNIVGERVLGLPAEPRVDKDVPYRDSGGRASASEPDADGVRGRSPRGEGRGGR